MSDEKLTDQTEITTLQNGDWLYVVDISDTAEDAAGSSKKIQYTNVGADFVLLNGRATGQTIIGGTASGEDLTLQSTSNATKGSIILGSNSAYDETKDSLVIGSQTAQTIAFADSTLQVLGTGYSDSAMNFARYSSNAGGPNIFFFKSRATTIGGANTIVSDDDSLGTIFFAADDGVDNNGYSAYIKTKMDGTPGAGDLPGEMIFATTAVGADASTEHAFLKPSGNLSLGSEKDTAKLYVDQSNTSAAIPVLTLDQADVSEEMIQFETTIGTGNAIEAVGAKTLTTTHFIKVTLPGGLTRYIPAGTIA